MATEPLPLGRTVARPHLDPSVRSVRVGLLGCGTVGSEVARRLLAGFQRGIHRFELARIAVRDPAKPRPVVLPSPRLTTDALSIAKDPEIDVVIELVGGLEIPHESIRHALVEGKSVVTANKELIARHGAELSRLADERGVALRYEGAVGGAAPFVTLLEQALVGDRVRSFRGILNGTTNLVLTRMAETDCSLEEAVAEAARLGYAERDARADLSGADAAHKASILAAIAFGRPVASDNVIVRGIECVTPLDVAAARSVGHEIKLVATAHDRDGRTQVCVGPESLPKEDVLAGVSGANNCLVVDAELGGRLTVSGPGAGGEATASAVLGDLVRCLSPVTPAVVGCGPPST